MKKIKSFVLIISINLLLILSILGLIVTGPILVKSLHTTTKKITNYRASLSNYKEFRWAEQHFREFASLKTEYRDFIAWRRLSFQGETINIDADGIRKTFRTVATSNDKEFHFFGGSTMWGTGVTDEYTIPSVLSKEYGIKATNYGESGYIARQSLDMLINIYTDDNVSKSGNTIVFFDGVNDVATLCRYEINKLSTSQEARLNAIKDSYLSWSYIVLPAIELTKKLKEKMSGLGITKVDKGKYYNCDSNRKKAETVAKTLVRTWNMASILAQENGDNFVAILQPVSFIGSPNIENLYDTEFMQNYKLGLDSQFEALYPLIKKYSKELGTFNFLDFSDAYDGEKIVYIDYAHVSPQGHFLLLNKFDKHKKLFGF